MDNKDTLVIRITGDSGDGVQLVGEQLTLTAAQSGRDVRTLPDFPAEIRAPAGTVAGVSGFQLAMADKAIFTAGESLDVLVALNPAALKSALEFLNPGGLLILNADSLSEQDWKKAKLTPEWLEAQREHYHILELPLIQNTQAALSHAELSHAQTKKAKNFYVLGVILWLFDLPIAPSQAFIAQKFAQHAAIAKGNAKALEAGYNYAMTLELSRQHFTLGHVVREKGEYRQVTGVEAVGLALATLAVTLNTTVFVSGYPITPASAILHECIRLNAFGIATLQAEDEIAAICACLGAAYGGQLALTCTSGPGFDLKSEALGLGVMTELPLVILDVQRAGGSTGLPTKTGQSDLQQALYGRHGESPLPVLAPTSPADCFHTVLEAFSIAVKAMTPVVVLMDAYLANAAEPWRIPSLDSLSLPVLNYHRNPKPFARDEHMARSWNIPGKEGFIHQLGGLEKQGEEGRVSYDAANHERMVHVRAQKIKHIATHYPELSIQGNPDADMLIVGWGSTEGSICAAMQACEAQGITFAHVQLKHLNPLPLGLEALFKAYSKILVAELNTGQLCRLLRAEYLVDAKAITQCNGQPFSLKYLIDALLTEAHHDAHV